MFSVEPSVPFNVNVAEAVSVLPFVTVSVPVDVVMVRPLNVLFVSACVSVVPTTVPAGTVFSAHAVVLAL